jgi:rhodanese-related sulfurtransferase
MAITASRFQRAILIGLLTLFALISLGCRPAAKPTSSAPPVITGQKAKALVSSGALLIDVRSPGEFNQGHIDGARLLPVQELSARVDEVKTWAQGDLKKPLVVYCRSGQRSAQAARMLRRAGFADVFDLGGIGNWPR